MQRRPSPVGRASCLPRSGRAPGSGEPCTHAFPPSPDPAHRCCPTSPPSLQAPSPRSEQLGIWFPREEQGLPTALSVRRRPTGAAPPSVTRCSSLSGHRAVGTPPPQHPSRRILFRDRGPPTCRPRTVPAPPWHSSPNGPHSVGQLSAPHFPSNDPHFPGKELPGFPLRTPRWDGKGQPSRNASHFLQ